MKSRLATPLLAIALLLPLAGWAQISIAIAIRPPPPLPVYVQPPVPAPGYLWTPGYWTWSEPESDYYWVPGTWVLAPTPGYLWTPGYWAFTGSGYRWNRGYWASRVGFYGGIDYGFGYTGSGYHGGRWDRGVFHYNQAANNVNTTVVRNVYNTRIVNVTHNETHVKRVSFNGGPQGVAARPTANDERVKTARHIDPTPNQVEHEMKAREIPNQKASVNRGAPQVAATPKAAEIIAPGATRATNKVEGLDDRGPAPQDAKTTQKKLNADDRKTVQPRPGATDAAPQSMEPGQPAARKGNKPASEHTNTSAARREPKAGRNEQKAAKDESRAPPNQAAEPRGQNAARGKERQGDAS